MTQTELVKIISTKMDVTQKLAKEVVDTVFDTVKEGMIQDGVVKVSGFGTFEKKTVNARQGRNPATGEAITIAAHNKPAFKAASALKEVVNQ